MNTKRKFLKIFLIIITTILLVAISFSYIYFLNTREKIITQNSDAIICEEENIEYGDNFSYQEILEKLISSNGLVNQTVLKIYIQNNLITDDMNYIFDTVGDITISIETTTPIFSNLSSISFFNQQAVVNKQVIWKVQDTKNPVLLGVHDIELIAGEPIDVKSGISAVDEIDGNLDVIIEGQLDFNTAGEYLLVAKTTDKNNNETKQEFKVTVNDKIIETQLPSTTTSTNINSNKSNSSSNNSTKNQKTNSSTSNKNSNSNTSNNNSLADPTSTKEGRLSLAKTEAKRVVSKIIKSGMTKLEKAEAICNYITTTVDVQTNQSSEAYKTNYGNEAYAALVLKIAACSGRCKAVTLLCDAAGLKSQHINANQWSHQWNKIQIDDGSWVVVDAQIGFVGDRHPLE